MLIRADSSFNEKNWNFYNFKDFVNVGKDLTVDGETIINGDVYARKGYNLLN